MRLKIFTIFFTIFLFIGFSYSSYSNNNIGDKSKGIALSKGEEKALKVYQKNLLGDLLTKIIHYNWVSNWVYDYQELYSYDAQNRETEALTQSYESNKWVNKERTLNYYSTGLQPIEMVNQEYKNNNWVNVSRTLLSWNSQNNTTESIDQEWNDTGWVNKTKITYNYSSNKLMDQITQTWSGVWVNQSKIVYTYNSSTQITEMTMLDWKSNSWQNNMRYLLSYDSHGNNYLEEI